MKLYAPKNIICILMVSTFLLSIASCMVIPYYALMMSQQLHLPVFYIGCILGVANFLQFGFSVFGVKFQYYFGNYYSLILSLAMRLIGFLLIATFYTHLVILGICISSIGMALYFPIAKSLIVKYSDKNKIQLNIAIFGALLNSGMLIGPAIGAIMIYYQQNGLMLYISCIILILLILLNILSLSNIENAKNTPNITHTVALSPTIKFLLILQIIFVLLFVGYQNFIALYLAKINLSLYPIVATSTCLVGICHPLFVSQIKRLKMLYVIFLSFFCLGCSFLIFAIKGELILLWVAVFIAATLAVTAEVVLFLKIDFIVSNIFKDHTTYIFGLFRFASGLGLLIGNLFAGLIYSLFEANQFYYWISMGIVTLVCAIFFLKIMKTQYYNELIYE